MDSHTSLFTFEKIKINKYSFWAGEFWSNKRFKNLLENHGGGGARNSNLKYKLLSSDILITNNEKK